MEWAGVAVAAFRTAGPVAAAAAQAHVQEGTRDAVRQRDVPAARLVVAK